MRILIVSDIHSNIVALETVLAAAGTYDTLWCLGDIIGYGPHPNKCIDAIYARTEVSICGNHDLACLGKVDLDDFNPDARKANEWNGRQLSTTNRAWIEKLPALQRIDETFTLAHGSPREPVWEYLLMPEQAQVNFHHFSSQICLIGHSHIPLVFRSAHEDFCERIIPDHGHVLQIEPGVRYFVNPGSVGQPRDQDPRAAYIIYDSDTGTISFQRIAYDIAQTQRQMRDVGLPGALIRRLEFGM